MGVSLKCVSTPGRGGRRRREKKKLQGKRKGEEEEREASCCRNETNRRLLKSEIRRGSLPNEIHPLFGGFSGEGRRGGNKKRDAYSLEMIDRTT